MVIVGARGFLGQRLATALSSEEPVIRVVRSPGYMDALELDLRSDSALERLLSIATDQTVFYCANIGGRESAAADPISAYRINAFVPKRLAAVARRIIYFSTDYVFSKQGSAVESSPPSPDSIYAHSKTLGERGVLESSSSSLVIRVSGLYDEKGTRARSFKELGPIVAPDDKFTNPTYIPDLIKVVKNCQVKGDCGIRHVCSSDAISQYEFQQLASLVWGFEVRPVLSAMPRSHISFRPSLGISIRTPAEVFTSGISAHRRGWRMGSVVVLDCVGVVLSSRRWREPDIKFWNSVESDSNSVVRTLGAERVASAYCPNPRFWGVLRRQLSNVSFVLVNNGPWASFSRWNERYGFTNIFNVVINSERDRIAKPEERFHKYIKRYAAGRPIYLVDDQLTIVSRAAMWGWDSRRATRIAAWPVEEYEYEGRNSLWINK